MTRTNASKARKAAQAAKTKADQAAKAVKAAQAAKAHAAKAKARAAASATASGAPSGTSFEPFTIRCAMRTVLVSRPRTFKAAVHLVYRNFRSLRGRRLCFRTTQVHITQGYPVELTPDSWVGVMGSITSVEVAIGQDY